MKVLVLSVFYCVFLTTQNVVQSARILGIFPTAARSHYILGSAFMKELAHKGHDVTIISPFSEKDKPKNGTWTEIVLDGIIEKQDEMMKDINVFEMTNLNKMLAVYITSTFGTELASNFLKHPKVQEFLASDAKFDAVVVEQFLNDAHKYIATHFNAPLITLSLFGQSSWSNHLVGNPELPSFVGDLMLGNLNHMDLWTRVQNTLFYVFVHVFNKLWYHPMQEALYHDVFPNAKEDFYDVMYNSSLLFQNSHASTWEPTNLMPNQIEIGGYHIQPTKPLPKDLKQFLDSAVDGAVYFSMGSNFKGKDLPVEMRNTIIRVFSKLKQKVLWKFEAEMPGKPDNVKIVKWAPQTDILAHPNVKLFITHGGFGGFQETIHFGVPILAMPVFGDQELNARRAINDGFGRKFKLHDLNNEKLFEATLKEMLNNPKYMENAKKRSKIMHDRPRSAKDTLTYWVEYVIRHQGAPHLRTAAMELTWYQYIMLDVLAIIAGAMTISVLFVFYLVKFCCCRNKSQKKVKQN